MEYYSELPIPFGDNHSQFSITVRFTPRVSDSLVPFNTTITVSNTYEEKEREIFNHISRTTRLRYFSLRHRWRRS